MSATVPASWEQSCCLASFPFPFIPTDIHVSATLSGAQDSYQDIANSGGNTSEGHGRNVILLNSLTPNTHFENVAKYLHV